MRKGAYVHWVESFVINNLRRKEAIGKREHMRSFRQAVSK